MSCLDKKLHREFNINDFYDYTGDEALQLPAWKGDQKKYKEFMTRYADGVKYIVTPMKYKVFTKENIQKTPFISFEKTENMFRDRTVYILAPGPSLGYVDKNFWDGKLTIAINSAGFYTNSKYWLIAEGIYLQFVMRDHLDRKFLGRKNMLLTSMPLGVYWRRGGLKMRGLFNKIYYLRLMEHDLVPIPCNGVTAFCAIAFAEPAGIPASPKITAPNAILPTNVSFIRKAPLSENLQKINNTYSNPQVTRRPNKKSFLLTRPITFSYLTAQPSFSLISPQC